MRLNPPALPRWLVLAPPALVTFVAVSAAHAGPLPWATLGQSSQRQAHSPAVGPEDPAPAPAPWPYLTGHTVATSPAIDADGLAYFASEKDVHVVEDRGSGHVIYSAPAAIQSSPTLFRSDGNDGLLPLGALYFGAEDGWVRSIDLAGKLRWQVRLGRLPIRSSPAVTQVGRDIFVAVADQSTLYMIRETASGLAALAWFTSVVADPKAMTSPAMSRDGTRVFFATADGRLRCNELTTGAPRGVFAPGTATAPVGRLTTPLVTDTMMVVFGAEDGHVYGTDGDCRLLAGSSPGGAVRVPVAQVGGDFVVNADGTLFLLDAALNPTWNMTLPANTSHAAPISDGVARVYFAGEDAMVHGVALPSGTNPGGLWWSASLPFSSSAQLGTPAMAADGSVYVPGFEGWLHVLRDIPAFRITYQSPLRGGTYDIAYLTEIYGALRARTVFQTPGSDDRQPSFDYGPERLAEAQSTPATPLDVLLGGRGLPYTDVTTPGPGLPFTASSLEYEPAFSAIDPGTGASRLQDKGRYVGYSLDLGSGPQIWFTDLDGLARGLRSASSIRDWAIAQGVPTLLAQQLVDPSMTRSQLALSPDGSRLAFRACPTGQTIGCVVQVLTMAGGASTLLPVGAIVGQEGGGQLDASSPAFSPDGNFLAVRSGAGLMIYPQASTMVPLTIANQPGETLDNPSWSPDGTEIVAASATRASRLPIISHALVIFSGKLFQTRASLGSGSGNDDQPFYHYRRFPAPIAGGLTPDRAFTGDVIGVRGRGFDLIDPKANWVSFTDVLGKPVRAEVVRGEVDPFTGEGILWTKVPVQAGNGAITVQTRYGTVFMPSFFVLPRPVSLRQTRSAEGLFIRVAGTGFDLSGGTATFVDFTAQSGTWVNGPVWSATQTTDGQQLIVKVPTGVAKQGPVRAWARTEAEGDMCCTFERLDPSLVVHRTTGIAANAAEGCTGATVKVDGTDFPLDVDFGQGVGTVSLNIAGVDMDAGMTKAMLSPSVTAPDTAVFSITRTIPSFPAGSPGGSLTVTATSDATPVIAPSAMFRVPLNNIPIVFVPGTSGNSLISAGPIPPGVLATGPFSGHVHNFPQNAWPDDHNDHICFFCIPPYIPYQTPGFFPGEEVWPGKLAADLLLYFPYGNLGNHYLDVTKFTPAGTQPTTSPMVAGPPFMNYPGKGDIYGHLIMKLAQDLGRPVDSGANGIYLFGYDFRDSLPVQAAALSMFVDGVLATSGASSVVLLTHSLGGMVARTYYLGPSSAGKVDQMISAGGAFAGAPLTAKILAMGDTWGLGVGIPALSFGVTEWEIQALAQNWPTAYFQLPNDDNAASVSADPWFFDDVTNGGASDRRFIRDTRPGKVAPIATTKTHIDWLIANHNPTVAGMVRTFAPTLPVAMGDFSMGTGPIIHHRIVAHGYATVTGIRLDKPPGQTFTTKWAITGDGDGVVPYHGMVGLTGTGDDRVYVAEATSGGPDFTHLPLLQNDRTISIIEGMISGTLCTQPQAAAMDSMWMSPATALESRTETLVPGGPSYEQLPSD